MRPPRSLRRARGYSMLIVAVMSAACLLMVFAAISLSGSRADQARISSQELIALSLAERGLERTKAYLSAILDVDPDLDRALDPSLDDSCSFGSPVTVTDPSGDDHLPRFTDTGAGPVTLAGWGTSRKSRFMRVPWPAPPAAPQGAYLVRIDDDDDDQGFGFPPAQGANPSGSSCAEGGLVPAPASDPVRDRDRTVVVTSIGITPGTNPDSAQVRKVVRAVVGKREMAGLLARGKVVAAGGTQLCGPYANADATGDVAIASMCAAGCGPGCAAPGGLLARTSASACTRSDGGPCLADADPEPVVPAVDPGAKQWRPQACSSAPCTPYYLLTTQGLPVGLKLKMWDYSTCPSPRSCASDSTQCPCWLDVSANTIRSGAVYLDDSDPGLDAPFPTPAAHAGDASRLVFRHVSGTGTLTCSPSPPSPVSDAVYRYAPTPLSLPPLPPVLPRLPHGVWLIDGLLQLEASADMPYCPSGWAASLVVRGSVVLHNHGYSLKPPPGLEAILVAGGDLEFQTGNTALDGCGTGGVVAVGEQVRAQGTNALSAPLLVANQSSCFPEVASATAVELGGNFTLQVNAMPLMSVGPLTQISWSESAQ
ncbi:MAG: hypothetical protein QM765_12675 [Myxococcales bacterium]